VIYINDRITANELPSVDGKKFPDLSVLVYQQRKLQKDCCSVLPK